MDTRQNNQSDPKKDMITKITKLNKKNNTDKQIQSNNQVQKDNNEPNNQPYPFELPTVFDNDCQLTVRQKLELVQGYDSPWPYIIKGMMQREEEWLDFLDDGRDYYEYEDYFSEDSMDRVRKNGKGNDGYYSDEYDSDGEW